MNQECEHQRILSVQEWHTLAQKGIALPVTVRICGDSMRPMIRRQRDKVTIIPVSEKLKKGQIILFPSKYQKNTFVVHRIWKIRKNKIRTLGDGCRNPDSWMEEGEAWGVVAKIERGRYMIRPQRFGWYIWGRFWMASFPLRRWFGSFKYLLEKRCRSG